MTKNTLDQFSTGAIAWALLKRHHSVIAWTLVATLSTVMLVKGQI